MDTGFYCARTDKQYYTRMICCLTDMKEAWGLWALKSFVCPICVADSNVNNGAMTIPFNSKLLKKDDKRFLKRPFEGLQRHLGWFDREYAINPTLALHMSDDLRKENGHFPSRLAFSKVSHNAWQLYIVDILHQPKKGIFSELLRCLKLWAQATNKYQILRQRMQDIRAYVGVECFRRCWFDVSKITASNYRDIVKFS